MNAYYEVLNRSSEASIGKRVQNYLAYLRFYKFSEALGSDSIPKPPNAFDFIKELYDSHDVNEELFENLHAIFGNLDLKDEISLGFEKDHEFLELFLASLKMHSQFAMMFPWNLKDPMHLDFFRNAIKLSGMKSQEEFDQDFEILKRDLLAHYPLRFEDVSGDGSQARINWLTLEPDESMWPSDRVRLEAYQRQFWWREFIQSGLFSAISSQPRAVFTFLFSLSPKEISWMTLPINAWRDWFQSGLGDISLKLNSGWELDDFEMKALKIIFSMNHPGAIYEALRINHPTLTFIIFKIFQNDFSKALLYLHYALSHGSQDHRKPCLAVALDALNNQDRRPDLYAAILGLPLKVYQQGDLIAFLPWNLKLKSDREFLETSFFRTKKKRADLLELRSQILLKDGISYSADRPEVLMESLEDVFSIESEHVVKNPALRGRFKTALRAYSLAAVGRDIFIANLKNRFPDEMKKLLEKENTELQSEAAGENQKIVDENQLEQDIPAFNRRWAEVFPKGFDFFDQEYRAMAWRLDLEHRSFRESILTIQNKTSLPESIDQIRDPDFRFHVDQLLKKKAEAVKLFQIRRRILEKDPLNAVLKLSPSALSFLSDCYMKTGSWVVPDRLYPMAGLRYLQEWEFEEDRAAIDKLMVEINKLSLETLQDQQILKNLVEWGSDHLLISLLANSNEILAKHALNFILDFPDQALKVLFTLPTYQMNLPPHPVKRAKEAASSIIDLMNTNNEFRIRIREAFLNSSHIRGYYLAVYPWDLSRPEELELLVNIVNSREKSEKDFEDIRDRLLRAGEISHQMEGWDSLQRLMNWDGIEISDDKLRAGFIQARNRFALSNFSSVELALESIVKREPLSLLVKYFSYQDSSDLGRLIEKKMIGMLKKWNSLGFAALSEEDQSILNALKTKPISRFIVKDLVQAGRRSRAWVLERMMEPAGRDSSSEIFGYLVCPVCRAFLMKHPELKLWKQKVRIQLKDSLIRIDIIKLYPWDFSDPLDDLWLREMLHWRLSKNQENIDAWIFPHFNLKGLLRDIIFKARFRYGHHVFDEYLKNSSSHKPNSFDDFVKALLYKRLDYDPASFLKDFSSHLHFFAADLQREYAQKPSLQPKYLSSKVLKLIDRKLKSSEALNSMEWDLVFSIIPLLDCSNFSGFMFVSRALAKSNLVIDEKFKEIFRAHPLKLLEFFAGWLHFNQNLKTQEKLKASPFVENVRSNHQWKALLRDYMGSDKESANPVLFQSYSWDAEDEADRDFLWSWIHKRDSLKQKFFEVQKEIGDELGISLWGLNRVHSALDSKIFSLFSKEQLNRYWIAHSRYTIAKTLAPAMIKTLSLKRDSLARSSMNQKLLCPDTLSQIIVPDDR